MDAHGVQVNSAGRRASSPVLRAPQRGRHRTFTPRRGLPAGIDAPPRAFSSGYYPNLMAMYELAGGHTRPPHTCTPPRSSPHHSAACGRLPFAMPTLSARLTACARGVHCIAKGGEGALVVGVLGVP